MVFHFSLSFLSFTLGTQVIWGTEASFNIERKRRIKILFISILSVKQSEPAHRSEEAFLHSRLSWFEQLEISTLSALTTDEVQEGPFWDCVTSSQHGYYVSQHCLCFIVRCLHCSFISAVFCAVSFILHSFVSFFCVLFWLSDGLSWLQSTSLNCISFDSHVMKLLIVEDRITLITADSLTMTLLLQSRYDDFNELWFKVLFCCLILVIAHIYRYTWHQDQAAGSSLNLWHWLTVVSIVLVLSTFSWSWADVQWIFVRFLL